MRDDLRRQRLEAAHTSIASKHPHREIWMQTLRPVLVPVLAALAVLAVLVFGARWVDDTVSVSPRVLVLAGAAVLAGVIALALALRPRRTGIPRSWRKYM